jgi:hypothetical protein
MLNLLSITETVRRGGRQRRVNAGIPVDWARLYILVLLAGLTLVGCGSTPNIPPSLPGARLVPGTINCAENFGYVVSGDKVVWFADLLNHSNKDLVKTDPQSHEVLARTHLPFGSFHESATGFGAVWLIERGSDPSVYKFDAQVKSPPKNLTRIILAGK